MDNELIKDDSVLNSIFDNIKDLIINSRNNIYNTVNTEMLHLYWNIGKIIMKIQQSNERAGYGDVVVDKLSQRLTNEFGRGVSKKSKNYEKVLFSISNLEDSVCQIELVTLFRAN